MTRQNYVFVDKFGLVRVKGIPFLGPKTSKNKWMSQEVSISYNPLTNHLLTSCDIQVFSYWVLLGIQHI